MGKLWEYMKALGKRVFQIAVHYPLATAATVFVVAGAVAMLAFGKTIQIGGILGWLWQRKPVTPDIRVLPPPNRVDKDGNIILPGQSDDKGYVQPPVSTEIKPPSIFDTPGTITIIHPDKGEVKIPLPTGVENKDVKQVIEVNPNVYQLSNNDKGVDLKDVIDTLSK